MHFHAISTPGISLETLFNLFKSLLVNHSVPRPPYSVLIFSLPDVQNITNYVTNTYFRHLKLYLYTFTKKRVLHIHNGSTNVETPPPFPSLSLASLLPPPTTIESSSANNNDPIMVTSSSSEPSNETPLEQGRAASRTSVSQDQPLASSPSPSLSLSETLESHQQLSLSNVIANELSKEVQALASTSVNMQFDKLKSEFEKKMKQHEQVLMEKLELLETKSKKGKPK